LQSVENQGVYALLEFIITHFLTDCTKLQSYCKATAKTTAKQQTVENQALAKILCSFAVHCKNRPTKPTPPPT
jgi:hypothetical protein